MLQFICYTQHYQNSLFVHIVPATQLNTRSPTVKGLFTAQIRGLDLKNVEKGLLGLGAIDPYFQVSKRIHDPSNGNTTWHPVYRSEFIHNIINPYWDPFQLDVAKLCQGELHRELKITLYDFERFGTDRWLGEVEVTVEFLMERVTRRGNASRELALEVMDAKGNVVGLLVVLKAELVRVVEDETPEGMEYQWVGDA